MANDAPTRPLLVDIRQASELLAISRSMIYQLIDAGELTPIRIGRSVRFRVEHLEQFVESRIAPNAAPPQSPKSAIRPGAKLNL